ncbi:P antigen family member 1 [Callithrix jacchus]|uniref:PAGE family member 1 n=1 Tax=Callithrix jacchus TaxID=9483 RepID=F7ILX4_CALJA|nr:P antigen family member 1 [Callithrix jacchus]XP_035144944.1 P antigen family member 1 [Callithrix jacchus]
MGFRRRLIYPPIPICNIESSESSDEEPEKMEPSTQNLDSSPAPERMDEGASAAQGPEPETDSQELVEPMTECEHGDGPDVQEMCLPNPEWVKLPQEGLEPEANSQEQVQPMPGCEPGDGPAVKKIRLQNP